MAITKVSAALVDLDGGVVINESSADADFRVESNGNANMLFVDGGNNRVGIGTGTPDSILDIEAVHSQLRLTDSDDSKFVLFSYSSGKLIVRNNSTDTTDNIYALQEDGNFGIGTHSPSEKLHIATSSGDCTLLIEAEENSSSREPHLQLKGTNTSSNPIIEFGDSAGFPGTIEYENSDNSMRFGTNAGERMRIDSSGNVGIGGTPQTTVGILDIVGQSNNYNTAPMLTFKTTSTNAANRNWSIGPIDINYGDFHIGCGDSNSDFFDATSHSKLTINKNGNVGIGTTSPHSAIHTHIASSGGTYHQFTNASTGDSSDEGWKIGVHDDEDFIIWGQNSSETFKVYNNGAYRFTIDHNGAVNVVGSFSKGSGSFKIDHPLPAKKDTHHLIHSFVEAPQADNIYRGTVTLSGGTATVNLDTVSGMTEGTYVLLNTNTSCFTSNETDWDAVKGSVSGNTLTITCQNNSSTATVSWLVIGERHDQHMKDTEWTDDNGKVIVEPLKEEG